MAACVATASREYIGRQINSNLHQLCDGVHPHEFFRHISHELHRLDAERIQKGLHSDKPDSTLVLDMYMYLKKRSENWPVLIIKALEAMKELEVIYKLGIHQGPVPTVHYSQPISNVAKGGGPAYGGSPGVAMNRNGLYQSNAGPLGGGPAYGGCPGVAMNRDGLYQSKAGPMGGGPAFGDFQGVAMNKVGGYQSNTTPYLEGCRNMKSLSPDDYGGRLTKDVASSDEGYRSYSKGCPSLPNKDLGNTNFVVNRGEYNCGSEAAIANLGEDGAPPSPPTRNGKTARPCSPGEQRSALSTSPTSSPESRSGRANEDTNDLDAARRQALPPCTPVTNVLQSMEDNNSLIVSSTGHETTSTKLFSPPPAPGTLTNMAQSEVEDKTAVSEDREPKQPGKGDVQEDSDLSTFHVQSEQHDNTEPVLPEPEQPTSGSGLGKGRLPRAVDSHHLPAIQNITFNFNINTVKTFSANLGHSVSAASPPHTSSGLVNPTREETRYSDEGVEGVPSEQGRGNAASCDSSSASTTSPESSETTAQQAEAMANPVLPGTESTSIFPRQPHTASTTEEQPGSHSSAVSAFSPSESHHQTQVKTIQEEGDVSISPRESGMTVGLSEMGPSLHMNWPPAPSDSVNLESEQVTFSLNFEDEPNDRDLCRTRQKASHPKKDSEKEQAPRCRSRERLAAAYEIMTGKRDCLEGGKIPAVTNGEPGNTQRSPPAISPNNISGNTQTTSPADPPGRLLGNIQDHVADNIRSSAPGIGPDNTQGNIPTFLEDSLSSSSCSSSSWISSITSERLRGPQSLPRIEEESKANGTILHSRAGKEE